MGGNVARSGLQGECSQEWSMGGNVARSGLWGGT